MRLRRRRKDAGRTTRREDVARALALHRAGELTSARQLYEDILAKTPDDPVALHFRGVLYHQCGESDRAIASIERSIALAPDYADAHNNLGNVLKETNQLEQAFRAYRRVVALRPEHADAWNNLGVVLRGQRHYEEAEQAYARALACDPAHAAAWHNRGNLLARMNRLEDAVAAYSRVLELRPKNTAAYDALCRVLFRAGKVDQAIAAYHEWLRGDPGNSVALHMLAACTGSDPPARASDDYVRDTFDAFAASFDQVLDQLGYRAPALIGELLARVLPGADGSLTVVDAGCGTGLCSDFLRPRAKQLLGVDLSPGMLARARARNTYDGLINAELSGWLAAHAASCDLIVSADTLCYFGELDAILSAAHGALRPGGLFAFTLEKAADDVAAHVLNPHGRYSHAERYVRDRVAEANLQLAGIEHVVLRRESGRDVEGLLVSARRAPFSCSCAGPRETSCSRSNQMSPSGRQAS
jgi:predicted TPR repeat methyltransferase